MVLPNQYYIVLLRICTQPCRDNQADVTVSTYHCRSLNVTVKADNNDWYQCNPKSRRKALVSHFNLHEDVKLVLSRLWLVTFQSLFLSNLYVMVQVAYARRALASSGRQKQHLRHQIGTAAGLGCFALEDAAISRGIHITHPLWHCLACYAMSSVSRPRQ